MNISNCIVCSTPFPYRKGKQYCSNSCKQQAYNNNKAGSSITGLPEAPGHQTANKRVFYIEDYRNFNGGWKEYVDLVTYFFLTKNFDEAESSSMINDAVVYMLNDDLLATLKKENNPVGRQFLQFQNEFHLGNFIVKEKRAVTE